MGMSSYRSTSPFSGRRSTRVYLCLHLAIATLVFFAFLVHTPLPSTYDDRRDAIVQQVADAALKHVPSVSIAINGGHRQASLESTVSKYAYATLLAGDSENPGDDISIEYDKYFVATRVLAYQLLHAPETKTSSDIPFIVLVTSDVAEAKRERLRQDGAIVWEAPPMDAGWIHTDVSTWAACMTKLKLWELTQFDRIAFLDGDMVLTGPLDGIFDDPAVTTQITQNREGATASDEATLPQDFVFAGMKETSPIHEWPPVREGVDYPNINYLNAGFFVMQPSLAMLDYYTSLTKLPNRFDPHMPEQNLLNYAHRREGNMPWKQLDTKWNIHYPSVQDLKGGVVSLHEKWWAPVNEDLKPFLQSWRWRMEGYYEARDAL